MSIRNMVVLMLLIMSLAGCGGKKVLVGLDIDLYLHPQAENEEDLLLQAAIRSRLADPQYKLTKNSILHVRVVHGIVFLSGTVKCKTDKEKASGIAQETEVKVNNDNPITPKDTNVEGIEVLNRSCG